MNNAAMNMGMQIALLVSDFSFLGIFLEVGLPDQILHLMFLGNCHTRMYFLALKFCDLMRSYGGTQRNVSVMTLKAGLGVCPGLAPSTPYRTDGRVC